MIETDAMGSPLEVTDLDAEWLLALARDAETEAWKADRRKLRLAAQWCVLHPATAVTGFVTWSDTGLPGLCASDEALGGDGAPLVAAFTPEPFAAALGVSTLTGMQWLADALDLEHRLPRTWAAVEALQVAPWKARKIAQATHRLSLAGARAVDQLLADRIGSCSWKSIEAAVAHAIATHDPHLLDEREKHGRAAWDVRLHHRGVTTGDQTWAGTSYLDITGDTLDLTAFHDLVCDHAAQLKALGDTDDLGARKAKAIGVIANRQAALDLGGFLGSDSPVEPVEPIRRRSQAHTRLYLHLSLADLASTGEGCGFGTVERLGPATVERIRDWVGRSRVTIQPVLDMDRSDAIEQHDPPAWMRELVVLRDPHCVFPWCARDSRSCDLDHIDPYQEHGPPGQTRPDNLAPLCRRHHRAKTHRRWRYQRNPSGTYSWNGGQGQAYLVTPHGTVTIAPN